MEAVITPTPPSAETGTRAPWRIARSLTAIGVWTYAAAILAAAVSLYVGGDRWWWATLLLFGPRWVLAIPLVPLALVAAAFRPRLLAPLAAVAALLAGPITGFELPLASASHVDSARTVRVVTCNYGGGTPCEAIGSLFEQFDPDVVALQEWPRRCDLSSALPDGWHVAHYYGLAVLSRYPISDIEVLKSSELPHWRTPALRCRLATPYGAVFFINVHLQTPREGLQAVLSQGLQGMPAMHATTMTRQTESRLASQWVEHAPQPVLVAGDFNMPVESTIYQRYWSRFVNAFSATGLGWGFTKQTQWIGARIDHVLAGAEWQVVSCRVGEGLGGDHRPVIAELALRGGPQ